MELPKESLRKLDSCDMTAEFFATGGEMGMMNSALPVPLL
jgi:hypothetical protein